MTTHKEIILANEQATIELAKQFASHLSGGLTVYLEGDLGAGKTCFVRACLRALGHQGAVKSPTFTLVETYDTSKGPVVHSDLYRLSEPEELEYLGFRDYLAPETILFLEWPSKGEGYLGAPDLLLRLSLYESGRKVQLQAKSEVGEQFLRQWV